MLSITLSRLFHIHYRQRAVRAALRTGQAFGCRRNLTQNQKKGGVR